jgi:hypothetical protein
MDHFALFVFWIEYGTSSEMNVLQEKNAIILGVDKNKRGFLKRKSRM